MPEWLESIAEGAIGTDYGPAGGRFGSRDTRKQVRQSLLLRKSSSIGIASTQIRARNECSQTRKMLFRFL